MGWVKIYFNYKIFENIYSLTYLKNKYIYTYIMATITYGVSTKLSGCKNPNLICNTLQINNKIFYLDHLDFINIINNSEKIIMNDDDTYPILIIKKKKYSLLTYLYKLECSNLYIDFINGKKNDLRKNNIKIYHNYHLFVKEQYDIINYIPGHYNTIGRDSYIMKNPLWRIRENDNEYLLMYCENDTLVKLDNISYQKILDFEIEKNDNKKLIFYKTSNGYISSNLKIYMHQIITNCYGNGQGTATISVDHIDRDPFNNCYNNLRIATMEEQRLNTTGTSDDDTRRRRKYNAQDLPEGITEDMIKKYVNYYKEKLSDTKYREFFKVEHPLLEKPWIGTKKENVSIIDKLNAANKVALDLRNGILPVKKESKLPKYITLTNFRNKEHLCFDRRYENKRLNFKMVLSTDSNLEDQLEIFIEKVKEKYDFITFD